MPKKLTNDEIQKILKDFYNNEFEILSEYKGIRKELKIKHNKCGRTFISKGFPSIYNISCKLCNTRKFSNEEITKILNDKTNNEYALIDNFETMHGILKIKHLKCNNIFSTSMHHMINNNTRCPFCIGKNVKKDTSQFKKEIYNLVKNEYTVLGEYKTTHDDIKIRHNSKKCNYHEYYVRPSDFLSHGNRCPKCKQSKGEQIIEKFLNDNNIDYNTQYSFDGCRNEKILKFDFYLNILNIAIEFDGIQHFKPVKIYGGLEKFKRCQINDNIKTNYCKDNNIKLIRISYMDIKNISNILSKELLNSTTIETT